MTSCRNSLNTPSWSIPASRRPFFISILFSRTVVLSSSYNCKILNAVELAYTLIDETDANGALE